MHFKSFGLSDTGKARDHNEDSYLCNDKESFFIVADGMGGHLSGETASRLATNIIEEFVFRSRQEDVPWPGKKRKGLTPEQNRLLAAATSAHRQIQDMASQHADMKGMGTTAVGVIIEGNRLAIVNVGDSRLYRIRNGHIKQMTKDHTLIAEQQRNGMLTSEEARVHPQKYLLTSALGGFHKRPKMDISRTLIRRKDLYLLCTDGLHNMLEDDQILTTITSIHDRSLYKIGLSLILEANLAGGLDNITVILLAFE